MSGDAAARWRPSADLETARLRAAMLAEARAFFADHGILEVETPALSPAAASDPHIESVGVTLSAARGQPYFLHTSPEFAMKRLLCAGWPDIFQICKVYRDGEVGRHHQPEFTLVEWYRRGLSLSAMMRHTVAFVGRLLEPRAAAGEVRYLGYRDAFREAAGIDPLSAPLPALRAACQADPPLAAALGDDRDAWLDLLLTRRVAAGFPAGRLTVLHHYPASQAALARRCPADDRLADRFEVFCGDVELANGYHELTDAAEQRARCAAEQERRRAAGLPLRPLDERFLAAMETGLPSCCGVAVGFDRLVMLNRRADSLRAVQAFTAVDGDDD